MNIAEKILAAHAGKDKVVPGEIVQARLDLVLGNELSTIIAVNLFEQVGAPCVFDPEKIVIVLDHFTPAKDITTANLCKRVREFARRHKIRHYYDVGRGGIEHVLLPEEGLVRPGQLIIGGDSHTCTCGAVGAFGAGVGSTDLAVAFMLGEAWFRVPETIRVVYDGTIPRWIGGKDVILATVARLGVDGARYCALEFTGPALGQLDMASRFTMANMAIEMGGKTGLMAPDDITREYLRGTTGREDLPEVHPDPDASYAQELRIDVNSMEPQVAAPPSPDNVHPVGEFSDVRLDQVVLGSCTNGRIEDLRIAASLLRGRTLHPDTRMIVLPGTQQVYKQAMKEGIWEIFIDAGAAVCTPTCGPCLGGHMGVIGEGEVCLSTTSRNFSGRMGHRDAKVYLSGPAVAAASAVTGRITHPAEVGADPMAGSEATAGT